MFYFRKPTKESKADLSTPIAASLHGSFLENLLRKGQIYKRGEEHIRAIPNPYHRVIAIKYGNQRVVGTRDCFVIAPYRREDPTDVGSVKERTLMSAEELTAGWVPCN